MMVFTGLSILVSDEGVQWFPTSSPGVSWRLLASEALPGQEGAESGAAVLIRMDPGRGYPAHRHLGIEEVLVLAGGYSDADGIHRSGEYVRYLPGTEHSPRALGDPDRPVDAENPACILFATARGGIQILAAPESAPPAPSSPTP